MISKVACSGRHETAYEQKRWEISPHCFFRWRGVRWWLFFVRESERARADESRPLPKTHGLSIDFNESASQRKQADKVRTLSISHIFFHFTILAGP